MPTSTPDLFPSRSHTRALTDITAALRSGAPCVVVTGVSGIGKTALCSALAGGSDDRTFTTVVRDPRLSVDEVVAQLLTDFGLLQEQTSAIHDRAKLLSASSRFLTSLKSLGAHALVVIDDAERVDADVLDALRQISESADAGGHQLRLVLVGQPSLEARLGEPALEALGAGTGPHLRLTPLELDEVLPYVAQRAATGADDAPVTALSEDRIAQVFEQSEGIPARVNFFAARPEQGLDVPTPVAVAEDASSPDPQPARRASGPNRMAIAAGTLILLAGLAWWTMGGKPEETPAATTANGPAAPAEPAAGGRPAEAPADPVQASAPTPAASPTAAAAGDAPAIAPPDAASPAQGRYRITVASFRTAARAGAVAAQLQQQKLPVTTRLDRTGTWHQVIAGPYPTLEAARDVQRSLSTAGFPETQISLPPAGASAPDPPSPSR